MEALVEKVREAAAKGTPLRIHGGGTKHFLGLPVAGEPLDVREHAGILDYQPDELFVRAAAGTPLQEVEAALAEAGQLLPFEPPAFGDSATLGGTIACGLSGPARPWRGAARDFVLGCRMVNGRGELLRFGGEVIKNVAGYDLSRLQCGAFGTLGVLLELSIKTLPAPAAERTLAFELPLPGALERLHRWNRQPLPLTGAAWHDGILRLRLAGAEAAVEQAARRLGGEAEREEGYWQALKEHRLLFFDNPLPLWRLSLPRGCGPLPLPGEVLVDWGGAQRWLFSDAEPGVVHALAREAGGSARPWRNGALLEPESPLLPLHRRLKEAFDPAGILNPGLMHPEL
ncbi:MAG TPA: glycolate oxidase subunit GlcE [Thiolapillus brandeum]|uniref:Glycolate oxidase subunit GlcE n=1 Tax=Thiolapillus brandeum TaxID=1076588 RepID=A0A7C5N7B2_9GAMM|nr:glycolate oxidase subunit GlcE [Thiolapillus brandeum]